MNEKEIYDTYKKVFEKHSEKSEWGIISINTEFMGEKIAVGFKLTPKIVKQCSENPEDALNRYFKKMMFDIARKYKKILDE